MLGPSPSQKRDPEPDHRNKNPRCAPNCRSATKAYLHLCEREIREAPRPTATEIFGGSYGRRQRKGRREAPRPTAAEIFGGSYGRRQRKRRREAPRPTAAEIFGGSYGRRQRKGRREAPRPTAAEGTKGGATADGSGKLRRAPRPTAASSHRPRHPPQPPAATVRNVTLRELPQPPSVTSPFESSRSHRP